MKQPEKLTNHFISEKETRLEEKLEEETVKNIRNNTTKLYILKNLGMLVQDYRRISRIEKVELMEKLMKMSEND